MKKERFLKAKKVDAKMQSVNGALKELNMLKQFKNNHPVHRFEIGSFTPNVKAFDFRVESSLFTLKDVDKVANVVEDILLTKKAELEKEFAEI